MSKEPDWDKLDDCKELSTGPYCAEPDELNKHCFEDEDDYEDGEPGRICRHCWVRGGHGKCELTREERESDE
jgi:hypothetical protein